MQIIKYCGGKLIVFINTIFGLIGLFCFAGGLYVKYGGDSLKDSSLMSTAMTELRKLIKPFAQGIGVDPNEFMEKLDLPTLLGDAALVFILFGVVVLVLCMVGLGGVCCNSKCLLYLYGIILGVIILGEIVLASLILWQRKVFDDGIKKPLHNSLDELYRGDSGLDAVSLAWNVVMLKFSCCGMDNYHDFEEPRVWNNTYPVPNMKTPVMCCTTEARNNHNWPCTSTVNDPKLSNAKKGCYQAVCDAIYKYRDAAIGVVSGVLIIELFLLFCTIYIGRQVKSESKINP